MVAGLAAAAWRLTGTLRAVPRARRVPGLAAVPVLAAVTAPPPEQP
jgi:hypothetical protein